MSLSKSNFIDKIKLGAGCTVTLHSNVDDVTPIDLRKQVITLFLFVALINQVINYTVSIRTRQSMFFVPLMFTLERTK